MSLVSFNYLSAAIPVTILSLKVQKAEYDDKLIELETLGDYIERVKPVQGSFFLKHKSALLFAQLNIYKAIQTHDPQDNTDAKTAIKNAISRTPTDYYPYGLKVLYSAHFESDEKLNAALQVAIQVGKFEEWLQIIVGRVIITEWIRLSEASKHEALSMLAGAMQHRRVQNKLCLQMRHSKNIKPFIDIIPEGHNKQRLLKLMDKPT